MKRGAHLLGWGSRCLFERLKVAVFFLSLCFSRNKHGLLLRVHPGPDSRDANAHPMHFNGNYEFFFEKLSSFNQEATDYSGTTVMANSAATMMKAPSRFRISEESQGRSDVYAAEGPTITTALEETSNGWATLATASRSKPRCSPDPLCNARSSSLLPQSPELRISSLSRGLPGPGARGGAKTRAAARPAASLAEPSHRSPQPHSNRARRAIRRN